jgi:UV DNA damage repair endonuclease
MQTTDFYSCVELFSPCGAKKALHKKKRTMLPQAIAVPALENDDTRYSVADILWINQRCGVPLVFDNLHQLTR